MDSKLDLPNMHQGRKPGSYAREINNRKQQIGKLKREIIYLERDKREAELKRARYAKEKALLEEHRLARRAQYGVVEAPPGTPRELRNE